MKFSDTGFLDNMESDLQMFQTREGEEFLVFLKQISPKDGRINNAKMGIDVG